MSSNVIRPSIARNAGKAHHVSDPIDSWSQVSSQEVTPPPSSTDYSDINHLRKGFDLTAHGCCEREA